MRIHAHWLAATAICIIAGCASENRSASEFQCGGLKDEPSPADSVSLATLPITQSFEYKVDPYIGAACALQGIGKEAACEKLIALARSTEGSEWAGRQKIAILCRMLFTKRPGTEFKRAELGGPSFLGGGELFGASTYDDPSFKKWPLEPIELIDGIPFAIVASYGYEGYLDPSYTESYVRYCMTNCDWSSTRFAPKRRTEKEAALRKLLSSPKFQKPLEMWESTFLSQQIE